MRKLMLKQLPLLGNKIEHKHARELAEISAILDKHQAILEHIKKDLIVKGSDPEKGREGLNVELVLRALIVKQMNSFSYDELAFHIMDSRSYRLFCRIGEYDNRPSKSALHANIKRIQSSTLEEINKIIVLGAEEEKIEKGRKVRIDCTTTETNIHYPTDASLLWDSVRVLSRLLEECRELGKMPAYSDHRRRAKRRNKGIIDAKNEKQKVRLYRDLLKIANKTVGYAKRTAEYLNNPSEKFGDVEQIVKVICLQSELKDYIPLAEKVISQTERRVINKEKVPEKEKIVSIFEEHTNIIVKKKRETEFGHKICLTVGESSLILDCKILEGNPADSTIAKEMIERQEKIYGRVPRQAAYDGGFASKGNVDDIKGMGVKDVAFHKKRGISVSEMVKSTWVYEKLRRFRAGIEGIISYVKRCFGLDRCLWRGFKSFQSYVLSSVMTANLLTMARYRLA